MENRGSEEQYPPIIIDDVNNTTINIIKEQTLNQRIKEVKKINNQLKMQNKLMKENNKLIS